MDKTSFLVRSDTRMDKFVGAVEPTTTTKELLKKVAESRPIKMEFHALSACWTAATPSSLAPRSLETRCRPSVASLLVVFSTIRWITKHLIGFVDLFEF